MSNFCESWAQALPCPYGFLVIFINPDGGLQTVIHNPLQSEGLEDLKARIDYEVSLKATSLARKGHRFIYDPSHPLASTLGAIPISSVILDPNRDNEADLSSVRACLDPLGLLFQHGFILICPSPSEWTIAGPRYGCAEVLGLARMQLEDAIIAASEPIICRWATGWLYHCFSVLEPNCDRPDWTSNSERERIYRATDGFPEEALKDRIGQYVFCTHYAVKAFAEQWVPITSKNEDIVRKVLGVPDDTPLKELRRITASLPESQMQKLRSALGLSNDCAWAEVLAMMKLARRWTPQQANAADRQSLRWEEVQAMLNDGRYPSAT